MTKIEHPRMTRKQQRAQAVRNTTRYKLKERKNNVTNVLKTSIFFVFVIAHALSRRNEIDHCPTSLAMTCSTNSLAFRTFDISGFPSTRINLSPFTKDFRGGEQLNESID